MSDFLISDALEELSRHGIEYLFQGDSSLAITHASSIDDIDDHSVSFCRSNSLNHIRVLSNPTSFYVLKDEKCSAELGAGNFVFVDSPDLCFCLIARLLIQKPEPEIHPTAIVAADVRIGSAVSIGAHVRIGEGVEIGSRVTIHDGCTIHSATIGDDSKIFPGVRIGSSGLGSHQDSNGIWHDFPHFARVRIGSRVVIQDNSVINRGTLSDTVVGDGVRIGPLCWVGHGVTLNSDCFISQGVTIAGSANVGAGSAVWGNSSIRDGVSVGRKAVVGMGSAVISDIPAMELWAGNPAQFKKPVSSSE